MTVKTCVAATTYSKERALDCTSICSSRSSLIGRRFGACSIRCRSFLNVGAQHPYSRSSRSLFSCKQHNSSTVTPKTCAILYASMREGLYCSFSMEIIVLDETWTKSANCCCVIFAAVRNSLTFVRILFPQTRSLLLVKVTSYYIFLLSLSSFFVKFPSCMFPGCNKKGRHSKKNCAVLYHQWPRPAPPPRKPPPPPRKPPPLRKLPPPPMRKLPPPGRGGRRTEPPSMEPPQGPGGGGGGPGRR